MTSAGNAQQFADLARENLLQISVEHAAEIESFGTAVTAAYSTIRKIDTTGFEPAAIFVPTPSDTRTGCVRTGQRRRQAGRESD